jgi:hypothetical protein
LLREELSHRPVTGRLGRAPRLLSWRRRCVRQRRSTRLRASSPGATRAQDLVGPLHRRRRRGERAAHRAARADPDRAAGRPRRDDPADPPTDLVALIRRTRAPRPGGAEDVKHGVSLRPLLHPRSCLPAEGSTRAAAPLAGPIRGPLDGGGLRYRGRAAVPRSERTRHAAAGHKASFIIWLGVSALHVLAHLPATAGSVSFRRSRKPELPEPSAARPDAGSRSRGRSSGGLVLAVVLLPEFQHGAFFDH